MSAKSVVTPNRDKYPCSTIYGLIQLNMANFMIYNVSLLLGGSYVN